MQALERGTKAPIYGIEACKVKHQVLQGLGRGRQVSRDVFKAETWWVFATKLAHMQAATSRQFFCPDRPVALRDGVSLGASRYAAAPKLVSNFGSFGPCTPSLNYFR